MKKIFVILAMIFVTASYSAQMKINTYATNYGVWSSYSKQWIWDGWKNSNLTFTIQGSIILVNDIAKSTYITYGEATTTNDYVTWTAIDEKKRSCVVMMSVDVSEENYILIMYDSFCYKYVY